MGTEALVGFLTFFLGLLLGHRLTVSNERRKEFNEVASPIYRSLEVQRRSLEEGSYPGAVLDENSFIEIQRRTPYMQRRAFAGAVQDYVLAQSLCGDYVDGEYRLSKPEKLVSRIEALQKLLAHK